MSTPNQAITPFQDFVNSLKTTTYAAAQTMSEAKVASEPNFEEMKRHLLSLYDGVTVTHSFIGENGDVYDCVPIDQQPSLRAAGPGATIPPIPRPASNTAACAPTTSARVDKLGNSMSCPAGTIPMRRITLEMIASHGSLKNFFAKHRGDSRGTKGHPRLSPTDPSASADPNAHKYAHAFQIVENMGGANTISVGHPAVGPRQMSLSQHWYAGGAGGNLQTVEVGWQVQQAVFNDFEPHLFVYWTADGYQNTGSYNLQGGHFVQVDANFHFGQPLPAGGLSIEVNLISGRWWIFVNGVALGFYPTSLYNGGVLATKATNVDWGGETAGSNFTWPPMGTGAFPGPGAATQENCQYFKFVAGSSSPGAATPATLTANATDPAWYKIALDGTPGFSFGGPGGTAPH